MILVVDASVYVATALPTDVFHSVSQQFLKQVESGNHTVLAPSIVVTECATAIARPTRNPALAKHTAGILVANTDLSIVEITVQRAREAGDVAADHFLRGADSLYVQVAHENSATLITWDGEMLKRAPAVVPTMTPTAWLAANP